MDETVQKIHGMTLELEPGESWEDRITIELTREHWAAVLGSSVAQGIEIQDALSDLTRKAEAGDFVAMLMMENVATTYGLLVDSVRIMAEILLPRLADEAKREAEEMRRGRSN